MHYIFGAWYRGDEISRRGGIFYVCLTLGTLTAGLIQAGTATSLGNVGGLAGWRWMYIICAVITIPIGILGFIVLPGTPDMPNRWLLKKKDVELAKKRLTRAGHATAGKFHWRILLKLAQSWEFWAILWLDIFFWNACINAGNGAFLLWIKSLGRYDTAKVNEYGTIAPALGILYTLLVCFASDLYLGPAWAITASHAWNITGLAIQVIWDVPEPALWLAFCTAYSAVAMSSVLHGWVNHVLRGAPAERATTLVVINAVSQSTTAWTSLLVFPTVEAPRYLKGWSFVLANAVALILTAQGLDFALKRKERRQYVLQKNVLCVDAWD